MVVDLVIHCGAGSTCPDRKEVNVFSKTTCHVFWGRARQLQMQPIFLENFNVNQTKLHEFFIREICNCLPGNL